MIVVLKNDECKNGVRLGPDRVVVFVRVDIDNVLGPTRQYLQFMESRRGKRRPRGDPDPVTDGVNT